MAFNADTLTLANADPVKLWDYTTSDSRTTVTAAGYFSPAAFIGINRGDRVTVTNGNDVYVVEITGTAASGGSTGAISERYDTASVTHNTGDVALPAGKTINLDSATATLVTHAATITKYAVQVTSEALTTAAGASQAFVLTFTGIAATDLAFVQGAGGTNTREHIAYKAICTTNTITVTVSNIGPTNAINGTVIFNLWVLKA